MATGMNITRGLLAATWVFGVYSTWYLFLNNGTADQVNEVLAANPPLLPGTSELLKTTFTGIKAIDDQLAMLAIIFYPVLDGSLPHASLFGFMFGGQFAAVYILMLVESVRSSHRGKIITYTILWCFLVQNAIAACTIPIYLLVHLATSPTVAPKPSKSHLTVDVYSVATAPLSVALGFGVPFILQALPAPTLVSYQSKQNFMALWQVFPFLVGILQYALPFCLSRLSGSFPKNVKSNSTSLDILRPAYMTAFIFAAIPRVAMLTAIAMNTWFPDLFKPEYRGSLSLSEVLVAKSISSSYRPESIGLGNDLLLHYDEMLCAAAWLTWSVHLYFQTDSGEKTVGRWVTLIGSGFASWALAGPAGATILCMWARDELVLSGEESGVKKVE